MFIKQWFQVTRHFSRCQFRIIMLPVDFGICQGHHLYLAMSSILFSLPELYISYKKWVSSHPQLASDFETTTKWVSYFIAGRINNSTIVSELVYSLSNLLVLFNDRIICKAQKLEVPGSGDTLKLWLTVLDYSEVFFELSAKKLWGEAGKWVVIVVLQMFKCVSRLLLLFQHKQHVIENPPIPVLKRGKLGQTNYATDYSIDEARNQLESMSFVLKRSGKVIRKVEAAPPVSVRNWKPLSVEHSHSDRVPGAENTLIGRQLVAETLYVLKPIAHLGSVLCFGNNTWKPWMISLCIDLVSLRLHQTCQNSKVAVLSKQQQLQISRRHLALLLYLLRSPFYERHSKERVRSFLLALGRNIPLVGLISTPLAKYIPHWQRTYFYMWST